MNKKSVFRVILSVIFLGLYVVGVEALQLVPGYQLVSLKRGNTIDMKFTLTNNEGEDLKIIPGTKDWFTAPWNEKFPSDAWLVTEQEPFMLKQGESKVIAYKVKAPRKAKGELVGMSTFLTEKDSPVQVQMSAAVYVLIIGTDKFDGTVTGFVLNPNAGGLTAGVTVRNEGNVHIRFRGLIRLYDAKEKNIANFHIEKGRPVHPGQEGQFFGSVSGVSLRRGKYSMEASLADTDRKTRINVERKKFKIKKVEKMTIKLD